MYWHSESWVAGRVETTLKQLKGKNVFEDTEKNFAVLFATRRQQKAAGQKENPLQLHPIQGGNVFINFVH